MLTRMPISYGRSEKESCDTLEKSWMPCHEVILRFRANSVMGDAIVVQSTYAAPFCQLCNFWNKKDGAGLPAHVFHKLCSWLDGTSSCI